MLSLQVIHGPNLNLLGVREPDTYGSVSLNSIDQSLQEQAKQLQVLVDCYQSNHEGELIDRIHSCMAKHQGILINPGAYTHTSVAIRDAIAAVNLPTVEVHLSNIYRREAFRHHSYIAPVAVGQVSGFGASSYRHGLQALVDYVRSHGV